MRADPQVGNCDQPQEPRMAARPAIKYNTIFIQNDRDRLQDHQTAHDLRPGLLTSWSTSRTALNEVDGYPVNLHCSPPILPSPLTAITTRDMHEAFAGRVNTDGFLPYPFPRVRCGVLLRSPPAQTY